MTDEEFQKFLRSNESKVVLVELDYWDGEEVQTLYLSDKGYNTRLSPGVEHRVYIDAVTKVPSLKQSLAGQSIGTGELIIDNTNGVRDTWITEFAFDGRKIVYKYGSPDWLYADFREVHTAVVESRTARGRQEIVIRQSDPEAYLDKPIQPSLIASGPNAGEYEPIAYGVINNASARLIDGTTHEYQISDIAIEEIVAVKDGQVDVAGFTPDIATGTFTLSSAAVQRVTVDLKGAKVGGVFLEKAGEIIDHIITTRTDLPESLYDDQAFLDLDMAISWRHNVYVDERSTARQVINKILDSIGAKLTRSRDGKISVARLQEPAEMEALAIGPDDIRRDTFKPIKQVAPWASARLGYAKNYTVQSSLETSITEDERAAAAREYDIVADTNDVAAGHPLAEHQELIETTFTDASDAGERLTELMSLHGQERFVYELIAYSIFYFSSIGQTLNLTHPRFGFTTGQNALVYQSDDNLTAASSRVQIWL